MYIVLYPYYIISSVFEIYQTEYCLFCLAWPAQTDKLKRHYRCKQSGSARLGIDFHALYFVFACGANAGLLYFHYSKALSAQHGILDQVTGRGYRILVPDWLITSHVTSITGSDSLLTSRRIQNIRVCSCESINMYTEGNTYRTYI